MESLAGWAQLSAIPNNNIVRLDIQSSWMGAKICFEPGMKTHKYQQNYHSFGLNPD